MNIFFTSPNLKSGGAQRHLVNIINGLQNEGFDTAVFLYEFEGELIDELDDSVKIFTINSNSPLNSFRTTRIIYGTLKLISHLRNEKPDFLYSRHWTKIVNMFVGKILNIKTICGEGNNINHTLINKKKNILFLLRKITGKYSDVVIANSVSLSEEIKKYFQLKTKPLVIYNGLDLEKIKQFSKNPVNHNWLINKDMPVIISIGRLVDQKDYNTLLQSFKLITAQIDARLIIIGSGKLRKSIINLAGNLSISDKIDVLEPTSNPFAYVSRADIYVSSSKFEGLSNSILEAMALGLPVVSTDHRHGANEIIENYISGILVPVGSVEEIAEAVVKVLKNPELKESLGENARKQAQNFTLEKMVNKYKILLGEI